MKEIVIKIDDKTYNDILIGRIYSSPRDVPQEAIKAIRNGNVLPKGHGELIDARAFLQSINNSDYDTYNDYSNTFDWIEDAETLVEADKGEE